MPTVKKKWQGKSAYRYQDNPLEKAFALAWWGWNDRPNGGGPLDYLAAEGEQEYAMLPDPATAEQRKFSCTIIQWLGSPVGQGFLEDVLRTKAGRDFLLNRLMVKLPGVR
jgi:hypothetical protein